VIEQHHPEEQKKIQEPREEYPVENPTNKNIKQVLKQDQQPPLKNETQQTK
jgi:hypothetical protein